jgi:hypothetical protein
VNRKTNEINDLPTPHPRQCWLCVPPVIALKTRGPLYGRYFHLKHFIRPGIASA